MKNLEKNKRFWKNLHILKMQYYPEESWTALCDKVGISSATFRSSKCNCSLPSVENMLRLAKLFDSTPEILISGVTDRLAKRRQLVADAILGIDEKMFLIVERVLNMTPAEKPNPEKKSVEVPADEEA